MKVRSFVRRGWQLVPIEIELTVASGLPQIQFIGLADQGIKESNLRIKSALRNQGFEFPRAQQILVHLKPSHLRKSSQGLDLAIAAAILWETGQLPLIEDFGKVPILYGGLSLMGEVEPTEDLEDLYDLLSEDHLVTGRGGRCDFSFYALDNLRDLAEKRWVWVEKKPPPLKRPEGSKEILFTQELAQFLTVIACGEHHTLLAGPQGTGKTTLAKAINVLLCPPEETLYRQSRTLSRQFGFQLSWRPCVSPHHTASPLAMVGGGQTPRPGEISRAHGGVLILDELLEFHTKVQEALREPFEEGRVTISRNGRCEVFPAKALILATTNLCPCGKWAPGKNVNCRKSLVRCQSQINRLSGPLLDRFHILSFSHEWSLDQGNVSLEEILPRVLRGRSFSLKERQQKEFNSRTPFSEIEKTLDASIVKEDLRKEISSRRRYQALIRVARTLADLEELEGIQWRHLEQAKKWCLRPFLRLEEGL